MKKFLKNPVLFTKWSWNSFWYLRYTKKLKRVEDKIHYRKFAYNTTEYKEYTEEFLAFLERELSSLETEKMTYEYLITVYEPFYKTFEDYTLEYYV